MIERAKLLRRTALGLAGILAGLVAAGHIVETAGRRSARARLAAEAGAGQTEAALRARIRKAESRLKGLAPRGTYISIDTAANRLRLYVNGRLAREAVVSCGSGDILQEPGGERHWVFDTPRGEFSVSSKLVNPTWIKPDWAFIEEGEKPPKDFNERVDNDSLGDFALGFGNGYFIHGTLYTRLLGRNVTHGCVRVGDEDLKAVFQAVPVGARIYIY